MCMVKQDKDSPSEDFEVSSKILLDSEIQLLAKLERFLKQTFEGSSINGMKIDDMSDVLSKILEGYNG